MYEIMLSQFIDDDDDVITVAETDPAAVSVAMRTTGKIINVSADPKPCRPLGAEGFAELFVACAQAAYAARYDPLPAGD